MPEDPKKKSIDSMLQDAAIEKFGLKPVMEKIDKIMPLLDQVAAGAEVLKGQDGKTPKVGEDFLTPEEQDRIIEMVRPQKGRDFNDGTPGKDGYTPVRGIDYLSDDEMAEIKTAAKGEKGDKGEPGKDGIDGKNPTPSDFIEVVKGLKGKDMASFSQAVGSKIDISHIKNAGQFIFNGKTYKTEELMHGGGSGGTTLTLQTNGTPNGDQSLLNLEAGTNITLTDNGTGTVTIDASGDTGVASVTGTTNRITIGGTAENPTIDIAATYVGQTSITTLGTVTTGVWSATTIAVAKGGTGVTTLAAKSIWVANALDTITSVTPGAGQSIRINAGNTAWEAYTPSAGGVTSVTGTANRISSTGGSTPVIDIDAAYVGQSSITTLGTIATGVWNGTTIAVANGGTGVATLAAKSIWVANTLNTITSVTPGAGQSIRINAGNTAWEAYTPAAGTVTSVSGTANRITSTGGATPVIDIDAAYVGQTSITTLGTITTGTWTGTTIAVANGGTGTTSVTVAPAASSWAGWDANKNLSANAFIAGFTTTATAAATTTLTIAATGTQIFTGASTQTVKLPTTSVVAGAQYYIVNLSSGAVTVQSSGANTIVILAANTSAWFTALVASPTTAANWNAQYVGTINASGKSLTVSNTLTLAGTDGTTMTFPSTSATIARTDAGQTFTGVQNFTSPDTTTSITTSTTSFTAWAGATTLLTIGGTGASASMFAPSTLDATSSITGAIRTSGGISAAKALNVGTTITGGGNLTIGTSNSATVGTIELGAATDTTLSRSGAGVLAVEGVVIPSISSTNTLTNKRITRRLTTVSGPGGTPSTNTDNVDIANFTGLAAAITSMTTNLSGSPVDGDLVEFRFTDNGSARAITWGASFGATTVALPTTTVISTMLRALFEWNGSIWQCIAVA